MLHALSRSGDFITVERWRNPARHIAGGEMWCGVDNFLERAGLVRHEGNVRYLAASRKLFRPAPLHTRQGQSDRNSASQKYGYRIAKLLQHCRTELPPLICTHCKPLKLHVIMLQYVADKMKAASSGQGLVTY